MEQKKFRLIIVAGDFLILAISFWLIFLALPAARREELLAHVVFFFGIAVLWLAMGILTGKMLRGKIRNLTTLFGKVVVSNLFSVIVIYLFTIFLDSYEFSVSQLLGTALLVTIFEIFTGAVYVAYRRSEITNIEELEQIRIFEKPTERDLIGEIEPEPADDEVLSGIDADVIAAIANECGDERAYSVLKLAGENLSGHTAVLSTTTLFNVAGLLGHDYHYIINLHKMNDIRQLDNFLDAVYKKLKQKGYFLCCVETKDQHKEWFFRKFPPVLNYFFYSLDFIVKRIFPKFKPTMWIHNLLTRGHNSVLTRAEALGRLSRAGFSISKEAIIGKQVFIEVRKTKEPSPQDNHVFSTLIALPRVGQEGKLIKVYKLRTMHPYSEYIQDYVYRLHNLKDGGKFKNDFRITSWGGFARKSWIDEVPMIINIFKGEMKVIGVRPLSKHYFGLYRPEVRERRIKYKPGLIPPYYADLPTTLEEIQESEIKYMDAFDKNPVLTDIRYFGRTFRNIMFRRARSN